MSRPDITRYLPPDVTVQWFGSLAVFEIAAANLSDFMIDVCLHKNLTLKLITATDERTEQGCFKIWYVLSLPQTPGYIIAVLKVTEPQEFPSIAAHVHQAWQYERKIKTFFGLTPVGHPDLRPTILHAHWPSDVFPLRKNFNWQTRPALAHGVDQFQMVAGEGIYEIPVGPIHAGIIEPGHFRFSVAGEEILLLEPQLGYTHKGSEKLFELLPPNDQVRLAEKISGDSSVSHALAFCQAVEQLAGVTVPSRGRYLRVIYAELERLANHLGDIGAIMIDTGFNFGGAHGARLREMVVRINHRLTGSRFLRGAIVLGGVTKDISADEAKRAASELAAIQKDFLAVIAVAQNSTSLLNRLKDTGVLSIDSARAHGVVGVAARATGFRLDTRVDFPYAAYDVLPPSTVAIAHSGDVYGRFCVRITEVQTSIEIIQRALNALPAGPLKQEINLANLSAHAVAVSAVEGWRGEIMYLVTTDAQGKISRVAPRDPSAINWLVVGDAAAGNMVPDFPLINKSFNLSYSGNDL